MTATPVPGSDPHELIGVWELTRLMHDRPSRRSGSATGRLTLAPALPLPGGRISWHEEGTLSWGASMLPFTRAYLIEPEPSGGWWVRFPDGRPFHPWRPGHPVQHPCGPDLYDGLVTVADADTWSTVWDVRGPDTDQQIVTQLRRR